MTNQDKNWILFWVVVFVVTATIVYFSDQV